MFQVFWYFKEINLTLNTCVHGIHNLTFSEILYQLNMFSAVLISLHPIRIKAIKIKI